MNKICKTKIIISVKSFKLGSSCLKSPHSKAHCCSFRQYYIATSYTNKFDKKSQQLCKIEHSMNFWKWITAPQIPFYGNVRQNVAMIMVQFWTSLCFSDINLLLFSRHFSGFTTIGISFFFCKITTQSYSKFLVTVIQNTTVLAGGRGKGKGDTITSKPLENIFYEIK